MRVFQLTFPAASFIVQVPSVTSRSQVYERKVPLDRLRGAVFFFFFFFSRVTAGLVVNSLIQFAGTSVREITRRRGVVIMTSEIVPFLVASGDGAFSFIGTRRRRASTLLSRIPLNLFFHVF